MVKKLALVALLVASSAHAQFKDGNKLLSAMNGDTFGKADALGYVTGIHDILDNVAFCSPIFVTAGQVHDTVKQYLEQNPANRHVAAHVLINNALKNAWPCPKKGQSL